MRVDVSLEAMNQLQKGSVADETRQALNTGPRSLEVAVKRGDAPRARIVCSAAGCDADVRGV